MSLRGQVGVAPIARLLPELAYGVGAYFGLAVFRRPATVLAAFLGQTGRANDGLGL